MPLARNIILPQVKVITAQGSYVHPPTEILDRLTNSETKPCMQGITVLLPTRDHPEKQRLKKERKMEGKEGRKEGRKEKEELARDSRRDNLHNLQRLISTGHEIAVGISSRCCRTPQVIISF